MIKHIIYVTDNHIFFCTSLYGTSHLSLCIVTARHGNIIMSLVRRVYSNLYWNTSRESYIVVRHYMMFYASRITFCIVVRHCMMCHAFDDSTLYCVLFHLPHFYFCGCGVHHSTPDAWHALHPFLSCPWWRLAHFILGHQIQATNE